MQQDVFAAREAIAQHADGAALHTIRTGNPWPNPHPPGSDEALEWEVAYKRYLQHHSNPEGEASA